MSSVAPEKMTGFMDIDDMMARTRAVVIEGINQAFHLNRTLADYREDFVWLTGTDHATTRAWWLEFFPRVIPIIKPEPGLREVMEEFHDVLDYDQMSSREELFRPGTEAWTQRHFPGLIDTLHLASFNWGNDLLAHTRTKDGDLDRIGKEGFLVDDKLEHCLSVAARGRLAIRYCQEINAPYFVPLLDGPANYHEAIGPEQLATVLRREVLPLAA